MLKYREIFTVSIYNTYNYTTVIRSKELMADAYFMDTDLKSVVFHVIKAKEEQLP
ncbi:hypothetical protein Hanom_Chr01g00003171 [Helianthus anomalus]